MPRTYRCGKCNAGNLEEPACTQHDCNSTVFHVESIADTPDEWLIACAAGETMNCVFCPHNNTIQCHGLQD